MDAHLHEPHRRKGATAVEGPSEWNKIEHRLFSEITTNWRGRPPETSMPRSSVLSVPPSPRRART
ncbi:MAG: hypothetical protein HYV07_27870 [Deltaproteobacteria bacterium]|nr:hypothetical protein [Deltaproteobacteria bacterium]